MIDQLNPRFVAWYRSASVVLAYAATTIGAVVWLGYLLKAGDALFSPLVGADFVEAFSHNLKAVFPQLPVAMNPMTAVGFLSLGGALLAYHRAGDGSVRAAKVGKALAWLALGIGTAKFVATLADVNILFDRVLFAGQLLEEGVRTGRVNQIAPNTAFAMATVALSVLMLFHKRYVGAQRTAAVGFYIGLFAVLGYLYGVSALIGIGKLIPMALNTALAFTFVSLSALWAAPDKGFMSVAASDSAGGAVLRELVPIAVLVPAVLGWLRVVGTHYRWFSAELGLSLVIILVVGIMVWLIAREAGLIHKVDAELKQEKTRVQAMLSSIGDGIIATDAAMHVVIVNDAAQAMLGWTVNDVANAMQGAKLPQIEDAAGNKMPLSAQPFQLTLATGQKVSTDLASKQAYYYARADGTRFPVAITASPVFLDGRITGAIVVFRDITEERAFDRTKTEFISLASHQLMGPATAIKWTAAILKEDASKLTERQRKLIEQIDDVTGRMVNTVDALLDVSRLETGTYAVRPVPIDYRDVAREILVEQQPRIVEKKLVIKEQYANDVPKIDADPSLAKIIVENVVSNAVKYTPAGGVVTITIGLRKREKNLRIVVADSGVGIPKEQQSRIFSKMFRAGNVQQQEGTGLGLYLMKQLVEGAGGVVAFVSTEGKGTTFTIDLPLIGMLRKEGTTVLKNVQ